MKAKVIIENGNTRIVLTPQNEFETDVLENVIENKYEIINTNIDAGYSYGTYSNHKVTIDISKRKPKTK